MDYVTSHQTRETLDSQLKGDSGRKRVHSLIDCLAQRNHTHHSMSSIDKVGSKTDEDRIILIQFPLRQDVLIDLTFSLEAFHVYCQWPQGTSLNHSALKEHIHSIRQHIAAAGDKFRLFERQDRRICLQVTLIPSDEALMVALDNDQGLFFEVFDKGTVLTSPSTFVFVFQQIQQFMAVQNKPQAQWRIRRELAMYLSNFLYFMKNY